MFDPNPIADEILSSLRRDLSLEVDVAAVTWLRQWVADRADRFSAKWRGEDGQLTPEAEGLLGLVYRMNWRLLHAVRRCGGSTISALALADYEAQLRELEA